MVPLINSSMARLWRVLFLFGAFSCVGCECRSVDVEGTALEHWATKNGAQMRKMRFVPRPGADDDVMVTAREALAVNDALLEFPEEAALCASVAEETFGAAILET